MGRKILMHAFIFLASRSPRPGHRREGRLLEAEGRRGRGRRDCRHAQVVALLGVEPFGLRVGRQQLRLGLLALLDLRAPRAMLQPVLDAPLLEVRLARVLLEEVAVDAVVAPRGRAGLDEAPREVGAQVLVDVVRLRHLERGVETLPLLHLLSDHARVARVPLLLLERELHDLSPQQLAHVLLLPLLPLRHLGAHARLLAGALRVGGERDAVGALQPVSELRRPHGRWAIVSRERRGDVRHFWWRCGVLWARVARRADQAEGETGVAASRPRQRSASRFFSRKGG